MRESRINSLCSQGERIILPKVTDVISDAIDIFRAGEAPSFVAVGRCDAFHNIPAGRDRVFTAAAINTPEGKRVLVYGVLVFGSVSSPTLWGRYTSWLSRLWAAINPDLKVQTYVDDPIMTFDSSNPKQRNLLGVQLLWAAVAGFPIKLEKADAGDEVKWIGAVLRIDNDNKCVIVTIPADQVTELLQEIRKHFGKPVIGRKKLQSLAGALSFVAGIVPLMRPFLSSLWASITANDGPTRTRQLVHVRRIEPALRWI